MAAFTKEEIGELKKIRKEEKIEFIFKTKIIASIKFDDEVKMYVAHVPALKIWSQGKTIAEAEKAIMDATESYLIVSHRNKGKSNI